MKAVVGCLAFFALALTFGAYLFDYCVKFIFGVSLPWYLNAVGGVVGSEVTLPLAIILWLLSLGGVHGPFVK